MHLSDNDKKSLWKIIKKLKQDKDILAAILYGSALKSDTYNDIDLGIVRMPTSNLKSLKYLLQFPEKFDLHFLTDMPIIIAKEAIKGEILFYKDYSQIFDIFIEIIKEWESFRPYYELYLESVKSGL
ncbi:MAG: putative Nucleotidyltransferase domain protein [Promethearchaeota archaeon]|jgi:predicted nucleotidyltransferase|nr:MAG: putative Nucleotidyltransferase domain protein [Candidatus Lokiarchaeota archaeon]